MICTPEHMGHHMQVFGDVRSIVRSRGWDFPIQLLFCFLIVLLGHPVDEVNMAEVPADRLWVVCRHLRHLLHHGWPASVLLWDNHLVNVQRSDVLEPVRIFQTLKKGKISPVHVSVNAVIVDQNLMLPFVHYSVFQD